jgi:hypothetical protein
MDTHSHTITHTPSLTPGSHTRSLLDSQPEDLEGMNDMQFHNFMESGTLPRDFQFKGIRRSRSSLRGQDALRELRTSQAAINAALDETIEE